MDERDIVIIRGKAGIVDKIDPDGYFLVNFGGVIEILPENTPVEYPPEDMKEILELNLRQQEADFRERMAKATAPLVEALERYHNDKHFGFWLWRTIKNFLKIK